MTNAPDIDDTSQETPPSDLLDRVVWLLFRLAHRAERSIFLPLPLRLVMIWILRPVEAVARSLVMRALWRLGMPANVCWELNALPPIGADVDSVEKLLRLATNLTAFAMTIKALPRAAFDDHFEADWEREPRSDVMARWLNLVAVHFALGRRRQSAIAAISRTAPRREVRARPDDSFFGPAHFGPA